MLGSMGKGWYWSMLWLASVRQNSQLSLIKFSLACLSSTAWLGHANKGFYWYGVILPEILQVLTESSEKTKGSEKAVEIVQDASRASGSQLQSWTPLFHLQRPSTCHWDVSHSQKNIWACQSCRTAALPCCKMRKMHLLDCGSRSASQVFSPPTSSLGQNNAVLNCTGQSPG